MVYYDENCKSTETLVRNLIDIVSKGGNYLLNVGPTKEGRIPEPSMARLREVGAWLEKNGEAIYGTVASPFRGLTWGRCTRKVADGMTTLYLHVFDGPSDGRLVVGPLPNEAVSARLLSGGSALSVSRDGEHLVVAVPAAAPDSIASVVELKVKGDVPVAPWVGRPGADGVLALAPDEADTTGALKAEGHGRHRNLGFWTDPSDCASWTVELPSARSYSVAFEAAAEGASKVVLAAGDSTVEIPISATGDFKKYTGVRAGPVKLPAGRQIIELRAVRQGWCPVNVRTLQLRPAE